MVTRVQIPYAVPGGAGCHGRPAPRTFRAPSPPAVTPDDALAPSARRFRRLLDGAAAPTKAEAAALLGLSARSVTRLVRDLRRAGVPVQERADGRAKRFFLAPEDQRRHVRFESLDEGALLALTVAAEAARATLAGTPLDEPLARACAALVDAAQAIDGGAGPDSFDPETESGRWYFSAAPVEPLDAEVFATLRRAIAAGRRVRLSERDGRTREHSPLALALVGGRWTLASAETGRDHVSDLRLHDIATATELDQAARYVAGFDPQRHFDPERRAGVRELHDFALDAAVEVAEEPEPRGRWIDAPMAAPSGAAGEPMPSPAPSHAARERAPAPRRDESRRRAARLRSLVAAAGAIVLPPA